MHLSAFGKPQSFALLLQMPFGKDLQSARNLKRLTLIKQLQAELEKTRVQGNIVGIIISNEFDGYSSKFTSCLLPLSMKACVALGQMKTVTKKQ